MVPLPLPVAVVATSDVDDAAAVAAVPKLPDDDAAHAGDAQDIWKIFQ